MGLDRIVVGETRLPTGETPLGETGGVGKVETDKLAGSTGGNLICIGFWTGLAVSCRPLPPSWSKGKDENEPCSATKLSRSGEARGCGEGDGRGEGVARGDVREESDSGEGGAESE